MCNPHEVVHEAKASSHKQTNLMMYSTAKLTDALSCDTSCVETLKFGIPHCNGASHGTFKHSNMLWNDSFLQSILTHSGCLHPNPWRCVLPTAHRPPQPPQRQQANTHSPRGRG
mmetsp:Transcript_32635/g.74856  ORF Transcript_32635/g.74856 Transcript_32635/m.74856 type:complete len:114 (-) Transcript_32635:134-475(-)